MSSSSSSQRVEVLVLDDALDVALEDELVVELEDEVAEALLVALSEITRAQSASPWLASTPQIRVSSA